MPQPRLKVAVNTRLLLPGHLDGIGWFTYETLKRITAGHPEVEFHFIFDRRYSEKYVFGENVIPHILHPQARLPILFKIWYDWQIPRLLKKIKADVFVSTDAMASLTLKVPQLLVIHDINFEHYPNDLPKRYAGYWRNSSIKFARKADRLVTVSEFSKTDISAHYSISPDKIDVVYNGASTVYKPISESNKHSVRAKLTGGDEYFLFVGSIHPRKNLQRLLPAFDKYKQETGKKTRLLIVGKKYWINKEIDTALHNMKFRDDVIFTGSMPQEQLAETMAAARALVYVSYFEGFGIPIIEAFNAHTPVITSNVTAMPEIAGDAALTVDPFSTDDICRAMIRIDSDEDLRSEMIRKGAERAGDFSWDRTADKLWQSIVNLISNSG